MINFNASKCMLVGLVTGLVAGISALSSSLHAGNAFVAKGDEHYTQLGIKRDSTARWEDGRRTSGGTGSYEWWYTDAEFSGGINVVVILYSKYFFDVSGPARPTATIQVNFPDDRSYLGKLAEPMFTRIDAAQDRADVKIQSSSLEDIGNGQYKVAFKAKDEKTGVELEYSAIMTSTLPAWRPETGHLMFEKSARLPFFPQKKGFFAWFVAQPEATVQASLKVGDDVYDLSGTGYHDHNWGNTSMSKVINHWYWGRATIGPYNVVTADVISEKVYGYKRLPLMMIAKEGKILIDGSASPNVVREGGFKHETTGKFMDNIVRYSVEGADSDTVYTVEWQRDRDIVTAFIIEALDNFVLKTLVRITGGADDTYVRTIGDVKLTVEASDGSTATHTSHHAIWEQMHFGSNEEAIINE